MYWFKFGLPIGHHHSGSHERTSRAPVLVHVFFSLLLGSSLVACTSSIALPHASLGKKKSTLYRIGQAATLLTVTTGLTQNPEKICEAQPQSLKWQVNADCWADTAQTAASSCAQLSVTHCPQATSWAQPPTWTSLPQADYLDECLPADQLQLMFTSPGELYPSGMEMMSASRFSIAHTHTLARLC